MKNVLIKHRIYASRYVSSNLGAAFRRALASLQAPSVIGTSEQLTSGATPNFYPSPSPPRTPLHHSSAIKLHHTRSFCSDLDYRRNLLFICLTMDNGLHNPVIVNLKQRSGVTSKFIVQLHVLQHVSSCK